jgi:hypothetical protein
MRDLRGFAFSTLLLELVLLFSVVAHRGTLAMDEADVFLLQQASVDIVLIRLYLAWLALGLHRHAVALTFAVVPEDLESSSNSAESPFA